jgi:hypothetical protein
LVFEWWDWFATNPSAVTAETKAKVKALMERHAAAKK